MIVINEDIRVMKQEFKGKSYVSIRKWYQDNGEWGWKGDSERVTC